MVGKLERSIFDLDDQNSERINALAQCKNTSLMIISTHTFGRLLLLENSPKCSADVEIRASPLTLSVSSTPGIKNKQPMWPVSMILTKLSNRLLPLPSGKIIQFSSSIFTKPGFPPRGEQSTEPDLA